MTRLVVVGGINMDCVFEAPCLPRRGETLNGRSFRRSPGGKGADQAVAAARLGADVCLVGCVGVDPEGAELMRHLKNEGIQLARVVESIDAPTGAAAVFVCNGDSAVTVVPGANHQLTAAHVRAAENEFAQCDLVLAELGVSVDSVLEAAKLAGRFGKPFLLTPSPAAPVSPELASHVRLFLLNEHELRIGFGEGDWRALIASWRDRMVVTRGADGAAYVDAQGKLHEQAAFHVPVLDSTGAGDAFAATLAVYWELGIPGAMRMACAAAAMAIQGIGSQTAMPTPLALQDFLEEMRA